MTRPTESSKAGRAYAGPSGSLGQRVWGPVDRLGAVITRHLTLALDITSLAATVVGLALRPLTWRRTVRRELLRQVHLAGVAALPSFTILGLLVGVAMVYQAVFWLEAVGEIDLIAHLLVRTLVQEIAPVLVAVVLIGRTGVGIAAELAAMQSGQQIDSLDAMGLDPLRHLVVPRVIGLVVVAVALTVVFTMVALVSGFALANAFGVGRANLVESLNTVLGRIEPRIYFAVFLKCVLSGLLVGTICCRQALFGKMSESRPAMLSSSFIESLLAVFLITGAVSLLL